MLRAWVACFYWLPCPLIAFLPSGIVRVMSIRLAATTRDARVAGALGGLGRFASWLRALWVLAVLVACSRPADSALLLSRSERHVSGPADNPGSECSA